MEAIASAVHCRMKPQEIDGKPSAAKSVQRREGTGLRVTVSPRDSSASEGEDV